METTLTGGPNAMPRGLMHWGPMRDFDRFFDEDFWAGNFVPAMDVYQDKDHVIVDVDIPGVDPTKVDVSVENDVLTVSGSKEEKQEVRREDYYKKEIRSGSFSRSIILPMHVKGDQAKAEFKKGMLQITLPKADEVKAKKIDVRVKE